MIRYAPHSAKIPKNPSSSPMIALMKSVYARGLEAMIQAEIDLQPYAWLSEDHEEGKLAFREKRRPRFKGR